MFHQACGYSLDLACWKVILFLAVSFATGFKLSVRVPQKLTFSGLARANRMLTLKTSPSKYQITAWLLLYKTLLQFEKTFLKFHKAFVKFDKTQRTLSHTQPCILSHVTLKSSRACAPLLSFRASAPYKVCLQLMRRFCNSSVSTRSVFHTRPRSNNCKMDTKIFSALVNWASWAFTPPTEMEIETVTRQRWTNQSDLQ